jgi:uncharacterized delta-60 repeat protein
MRRWLVVLVGVGALMFPALLPAVRGDLDPTFGAGGRVTTDFGGSEIGWAVAVQRDGKIVVAGGRWDPGPHDFLLARYMANGATDRRFGGDGKVATDFGGSDGAFDLAVQRDGKIVAVGSGAQDFALARYRPDGSLDTAFGVGGKVLTAFQPGSNDVASAVVLQADGKIVAGGSSASEFALTRYLADGVLDPSFGSGGRVVTPISSANDHLFDLAVQPDGKLVAAGWSFQGGGPHIVLARYDRNGSLNTSFDGDGIVVAPFRGAAAQLLVQRDGKLLVAGLGELTRFNADGSLDRSFGGDGTAQAYDIGALAAAIQPDGKILVIGTVSSGRVQTSDFGVARLSAEGSLDTTFGRQGSVVTAFSPGSDDQALDGVLLPNGRLVVSGMTSRTGERGPWDFAVARYVAIRFCVVPNVRHKTLRAARSSLTKAHCRVGAVERRYSASVAEGRVLLQRPRPQTRLAELSRVSLVVSRGRRR